MTELGIEAEIWKVGYISLDRVNKYGSVTIPNSVITFFLIIISIFLSLYIQYNF